MYFKGAQMLIGYIGSHTISIIINTCPLSKPMAIHNIHIWISIRSAFYIECIT